MIKQYPLIYLFYFAIHFSLFAQNQHVAELQQQLERSKGSNDSIYATTLYYLCWSQLNSHLNQSENYANELMSFAKTTKNHQALTLAYDCKAQIAIQKNQFNEAKTIAQQLHTLYAQKDSILAKAVFHQSLGHIYDYQSQYDSAIYHWDLALQIYQNQQLLKYITAMQVNIGSTLYFKKGKEKELTSLGNSKNETWTLQDSTTYTAELNKMGRLFLDLANFSKAEYYLNEGLQIARSINDKSLEAQLLFNKGEVHFFQGNYENAIHYYTQSLEQKHEAQIPYGMNLFKTGRAFLELKNYFDAEYYLVQSIQHLKEGDEEYALVDVYGFLTDLYYETNRINKALESVIKMEELYAEIEEGERLSDFHKRIIEASFLIHPKQAKEYFTVLREQETVAQMYEVESAFQLEKKETEILLLNQKNEIARKNRYVLVLIVVLVLLILLIILQRNRVLAKGKRIVELESQYKNMELQQSKLLLSKKKDDFSDLVNNLNDLKGDLSTQKFNQLVGSLKTAKVVEKNWEDYISSFEKLNPYFFEQLKQRAIKLTTSEKRLCALIHQGMTISDIAHVLNLQKKSVESARYRLRKKFQLQAQDNLQEFIKTLCKANK
jgi:tetratricopeptide (TPR) repeat protein